MNKTPKINRLFLVTVIWILLSGIFMGFITFVRSMNAIQLMFLSQILYMMPVIGFMIINKVNPGKWMPFKPLKVSVLAMVVLYAVLLIPVTSWLNLLSMLFQKETGVAPISYFIRLKIQKACQYIVLTGLKLNEISTKLGFEEPAYFSRTFTKVMGFSPSEYRKRESEHGIV